MSNYFFIKPMTCTRLKINYPSGHLCDIYINQLNNHINQTQKPRANNATNTNQTHDIDNLSFTEPMIVSIRAEGQVPEGINTPLNRQFNNDGDNKSIIFMRPSNNEILCTVLFIL